MTPTAATGRHRRESSQARLTVALAGAATAAVLIVATAIAGVATRVETAVDTRVDTPVDTAVGTERGDGATAPRAATVSPSTPSEQDRLATPAPSPRAKADPPPRRTTAPTRARTRTSPMVASPPSRLVVPSIGVDVDVMDLGLTDQGVLEVPPGAFPAGWYVGSPAPGQLGPAVIAGHVRWNATPGVFARLQELTVGDTVSVLREDGSVAEFSVTSSERYSKDAFPTSTVYGDIGFAGLRLITCGGLDAVTGDYDDNVVVFAALSGSS